MINEQTELMKKLGFKCQKCGYYDPMAKKLVINKEHKTPLCTVCNVFAPSDAELFENYLNEKINPQLLETFRKNSKQDKDNSLKQGMKKTANNGNHISRPAFGYKMGLRGLVPADNFDEVRLIFESFSKGTSLNQISRENNLSVNGIKKILKNFTYIGKVKFNNEILQGNHQPIIATELFNRVQQRFERLKSKTNN